MKRLPLPFVLTLSSVLVGGCSTPTDFVSQEDGFKATFPSQPKRLEKMTNDYKIVHWIASSRSGGCSVTVHAAPFETDKLDTATMERILDQLMDRGHSGNAATVVSRRTITLANEYVGRESVAQASEGWRHRVRSYIVGKRLYTVAVTGPDDYQTSSKASKFLDSFEIVK